MTCAPPMLTRSSGAHANLSRNSRVRWPLRWLGSVSPDAASRVVQGEGQLLMSDPVPHTLDTAMVGTHEMFLSATRAGFTELQALHIIAMILCSNSQSQRPTS